jgi:hypothetical protein
MLSVFFQSWESALSCFTYMVSIDLSWLLYWIVMSIADPFQATVLNDVVKTGNAIQTLRLIQSVAYVFLLLRV